MQIDTVCRDVRSRVVSIDCGWLHAAAVLECGACIAWGSNEFGQLGTGHELKSAEPVTCATDRDVRFKKVVCGSYFTAVVSQDDELYTHRDTAHACTHFAGSARAFAKQTKETYDACASLTRALSVSLSRSFVENERAAH